MSLPAVASGHLQVWLTANKGVDCVNGEVTTWSDQSGKHRDAVKGTHTYTIFVVERRWGDRAPGSSMNEMLIGTDLPTDVNATCPSAGDQVVPGYSYCDGFPTSGGPSVGFVGGSIGRAIGVHGENRFQGDIAEIVIFDAALVDADETWHSQAMTFANAGSRRGS